MVDGAGSGKRDLLGGRYELLGLLGRGGMADVLRAFDRQTEREVAVKLFRPGIDLMESDRRLRREVDLLAALQHPGLVRVLDADVGDDAIAGHRAFVVMELIDGPNLGDRIRREALGPAQAAALGVALCSALAYVHERGVVHRDVKPANVLLPRAGDTDVISPKLTDFGIAQVVDSTRLTTEGLTVGTANYLSPEQVLGARVTPASDVYSLGLVLLEAITGEVAFPGHGVEAAVARLSRPPLVPPGLPRRLGDLLARMTARDPQHRPTAAAAGAELQGAADPSLASELLAFDLRPAGGPASLSDAGRHRSRPARRRGGLLTGAAAAVGVLAVLGAYLGRGNPASDGSPSVRSGGTSSSPHQPSSSPAGTISSATNGGTSSSATGGGTRATTRAAAARATTHPATSAGRTAAHTVIARRTTAARPTRHAAPVHKAPPHHGPVKKPHPTHKPKQSPPPKH